jgi:hypothetical protein
VLELAKEVSGSLLMVKIMTPYSSVNQQRRKTRKKRSKYQAHNRSIMIIGENSSLGHFCSKPNILADVCLASKTGWPSNFYFCDYYAIISQIWLRAYELLQSLNVGNITKFVEGDF